MIKKLCKFIKIIIIVILCLMLLGITTELFLGGKRLYDYNHTYSLEKKLRYLSDPWNFSYGFPQKNKKILKNNNIEFDDENEGFLKADHSAILLSTKHFDFRISGGSTWSVYDKKNKKIFTYFAGDSFYRDNQGNVIDKVDEKTVKLMKKELSNKMNKIGHEMNYQIYNPF